MYRRGSRKQDLITMIKMEVFRGNITRAMEIGRIGSKEFKTGFTPKDIRKYILEVRAVQK